MRSIITLIILIFMSVNFTNAQSAAHDEEALTASGYHPGTIRHIVLFKYKAGVTEEEKKAVITAFIALKDSCKREGKTYIKGIEYGFPNSKEGADHGMEIAFLLSFDSEGDRNYYIGTPYITNPQFYDHKHDAFKKWVGPKIAPDVGLIVFDYKKEE